MKKTLAARIKANVIVSEAGCWEWRLALNHHGYGCMNVGGLQRKAHRVSYETFVGPIPEGLQIDHLCRVRHCVNPEHLEPVTAAENTQRANILPPMGVINGSKTVCAQGHEFTPENTYNRLQGGRDCRTCMTERSRRCRARARART